ncbi:MAG: hypothetical protein HOY79_34160 [Streptomyces sp.]|nr:hypothetical protein [Streptomyces sp.]NUS11397.1 hypothetical protein [Streptomyces sp.]NUS23462.1 hypothetical protein [Streptomyces sp.]
MTATTADVAAAAAGTMVCGTCGAQVPRPAPGRFRPLWEAGWRWLGSLGLYSCPECPPVVVEQDGRHVRP